jgi:hypothetical protein
VAVEVEAVVFAVLFEEDSNTFSCNHMFRQSTSSRCHRSRWLEQMEYAWFRCHRLS